MGSKPHVHLAVLKVNLVVYITACSTCTTVELLQEGIWVVGMILGSPAQTAGVEQGDQLLQIDNTQVDGQSPFQAASAISGGDVEPDIVPEPIVHLQVRTHCIMLPTATTKATTVHAVISIFVQCIVTVRQQYRHSPVLPSQAHAVPHHAPTCVQLTDLGLLNDA